MPRMLMTSGVGRMSACGNPMHAISLPTGTGSPRQSGIGARSRAPSALISATSAAAPASAAYETTFFPLGVGNDLVFSATGGAGGAALTEAKVDARWLDATTGYAWYRIRSFNGDMHWIRQTSTGRIYEWGNKPWYR